jgi:zona occludens toxin (predicted ATPase)
MRTYLKDYDAKKALEIEKETMKAKLEEFLVFHEVQRIFGEKYQITRTTRDNWTIKDELIVRELLKKK